MSSVAGPYLSVVVTTRNDDHGGDPLKRLQAFVNTFDAQCRRTGLDAEVVVVEWNPPADRPRLYDLVRVPSSCAFVLRFIEVPSSLHARLQHADVLPLFQMIAKNVGIRRARGRFILSTNIDIIFSNELVERLASGTLVQGRHYRVDRHDIQPEFPVDGSLEEQIAYCQTHQLRLHTRAGTHPVDRFGRISAADRDIAESPCVTLGDGWHVREGDAKYGFHRWAMEKARLVLDRTAAPNLARDVVLDVEIEPNPYQPGSWVEIEIVSGQTVLARSRVTGRSTIRIRLDDDVSRHDLAFSVQSSSGGRECLPLFERRRHLCYRVHRIQMNQAATHAYDMTRWRRPRRSLKVLLEHTPAGVDVTSDAREYSYCAEYGPFQSQTDGKYEFLLEYAPVQGRFTFGVLDERIDTWRPSSCTEIREGDASLLNVSVDVPRGAIFWLMISNNHVNGHGVSRFVLRRLSGSAPAAQLACDRRLSLPIRMRTAANNAIYPLIRPLLRLRQAISARDYSRARRKFERKIVNESSRLRELDAQVETLTPLAELVSVQRHLRDHRPRDLHQNASGDFQLLAREHWIDLRGFAEFATYSMNIDGLFESVADAAGLEEHVFEMPLCIYHLEHEKGSGWTPEGEALLKRRMAESGITWLDASAVHIWSAYMQWLRRPMIFNGSDWGFGEQTLPETTLQPVAGNR
jgi:hypothetical protein